MYWCVVIHVLRLTDCSDMTIGRFYQMMLSLQAGDTPLDRARDHNHSSMVAYLQQRKCTTVVSCLCSDMLLLNTSKSALCALVTG